MKKLYRCSRIVLEENITLENIDLWYDEYQIIKETDKSYLIKISYNKTKRVFKNHKGSFAFETEKEAFENFKYRTKRSLEMCKHNLVVAQMFYDKYCNN